MNTASKFQLLKKIRQINKKLQQKIINNHGVNNNVRIKTIVLTKQAIEDEII